MWTENLKLGLLGVCALALAACGTPSTTPTTAGSAPASTATTSSASGMGVVQSIDVVSRQQASSGAVGTVAGAVVGGLIGNQVGSGRGRTAATVAGAAGGALAGNQMEKNARTNGGAPDQAYRVAVRMDNGAVQTLMQETQPQVQIGERVRLQNGAIVEVFR